jgi:hypothetical protein
MRSPQRGHGIVGPDSGFGAGISSVTAADADGPAGTSKSEPQRGHFIVRPA